MTRILVTGASGFIGRAVTAALATAGWQVRATVRTPPRPALPGAVEVVHADLAQDIDWRPLLRQVDAVVHVAGIAHTGAAGAAEHYDRVNRRATAHLAAAAAQAGVGHFVLVSSIRAQSGPQADHALSERDPAAPTDAYGRSKLAAEDAVHAAGVACTILRPVVLYGRDVKGNFALLLRAASSRLPLPLQDFGNRRSLLGIDNFISALSFVLAAPVARGETYVVADPGMALRVADVVATLRQGRGRWPLLLPMPTHYVEWPLRMIGRADLWASIGGNLRVDPGKLIDAGWQPRHDTRDGLLELARSR